MKKEKWQITIDVTEILGMHYSELGMEKYIKEELVSALDGCHLIMGKLVVKKLEDKK